MAARGVLLYAALAALWIGGRSETSYSHVMEVSMQEGGGAEGGGGEAEKGRSIRLEVRPGADPMLVVTEACDRHGLSDAECGDLQDSVGDSFAEYRGTTKGAIASLSHSEAIAALFGMKASFDTFGEAAEAGLKLEAFEDVGAWWRFQEMVGNAAAAKGWPDYSLFSEDPLYHFTCPYWYWGDPEAAALAKGSSEEDAAALLAVGDDTFGYRAGRLPNHLNGVLPTTNTCRHTMHLSALLRVLRGDGHRLLGSSRIVEIGGGYGNMCRLAFKAFGFLSWTILDLPFMSALQREYLKNTLGGLRLLVNSSPRALRVQERGSAATDGTPLVNLVDSKGLNIWFSGGYEGADVVIATSSLSELDMDTFWWYYNHVVSTAGYVLYAYQKFWPSSQLQEDKLVALLTSHEIAYEHESAQGKTVTVVFRKREHN